MKKRMPVSRKYSKKVFKKTSGARRNPVSARPHQRGGWRL